MKFPARKDLTYAIAIWSAPAILLPFLVFSYSTTILAIFVLSLLLSLWLWNSTSYEIRGGNLLIRCWIFRKKVNVANITKVRRTRNFLASYATALDRLEITERNGAKYYISPTNVESFIEELKRSNPNIEAS